jgi:hypothetical protein
MIEHYRVRPEHNQVFKSKIGFIETNPLVQVAELYYIQFQPHLRRFDGYFLDKTTNNFLRTTALKWRFDNTPADSDPNFRNVTQARKFYTYIRVLEDPDSSKVGQMYLFGFGTKIQSIMKSFIDPNTGTLCQKAFQLEVSLTHGFPNFDKCKFTNEHFYEQGSSLSFDNDLRFRGFTNNYLNYINRKDKLEKIFNV